MEKTCTGCVVSAGTHKPAEALHQIADNSDGWIQDGPLLYRLTDERRPKNRDEINVLMADGSRTEESRTRRARELLDAIRLARSVDLKAAETISALQARSAEMESQLEAIGAGGVEPLRKPAAAPQAVQAAVPDNWRDQFSGAVYEDLSAADNQDVPLEEYPARILNILDAIVGPRHPTVIKWRNDAIRSCIAIAYKYCSDPESYRYLKQDLEAMLAAPAHPAEGVTAQAVYAEARECSHCNHVGLNDSADDIATCNECQWSGDSPKEDKCPACQAEGTMTASCPKCHHGYRLLADATLAATQPAAQGMDALTPAARDVLAERKRQIETEGWKPERDDVYDTGEMALAAACYAAHSASCAAIKAPHTAPGVFVRTRSAQDFVGEMWPWSDDWWKPSGHRRNLEKAGALVLAEIERIDRAALAAQAKQGGAANG